jgi:hypothetical protein
MQSVPEVLNRSRSARSYRAEGTRIMPNYLTWRWRQVPERMRAEYFTLIRRDALGKMTVHLEIQTRSMFIFDLELLCRKGTCK